MKMKLEDLDYWRVAQRTDMHEMFPGKNRMIQAMKELYPIIQPYIRKKVVKWWDKLTSRRLEHTFEKFLHIISDSLRTPISGFNILYDGHYSIDIYCYPDVDQDMKFYYFPMSFLPDLKKTNKLLHDMTVEMFRIIVTNCSVWTMQMDGNDDWFADSERENLNYDDADLTVEHRKEIEKNLKHFAKYSTNYYNTLDKSGNIMWLQKQIDKYVPMVHAEKALLDLMSAAIVISEQPQTMEFYDRHALDVFAKIHDIEENEGGDYEFPDGHPVSPGMTMRVGWFEGDGFTDMQLQWLGDSAGNFGQAEFTFNYECHTAADLKDARRKYKEDSGKFLEYLSEWFIIAEENREAIYDYSKNRLTQTLFTLDEQRHKQLCTSKGAKDLQAIQQSPLLHGNP